MSLLDSLQNVLGQMAAPQSGQTPSRGYQPYGSGSQNMQNANSSLPGIFGQIFGNSNSGSTGIPGLGGLIGALTGKNLQSGAMGGALLMKGIQMFTDYYERMHQEAANNPASPVARNFTNPNLSPSSPDERARRIIRAMVYAAKSDGHIDGAEQQALQERLQSLNMGPEGENLIRRAMDEPLDPKAIADGIRTPDEALEVFTVSCAVLHTSGFMENAYLSELAKALAIPDDVKNDLIGKISDMARG